MKIDKPQGFDIGVCNLVHDVMESAVRPLTPDQVTTTLKCLSMAYGPNPLDIKDVVMADLTTIMWERQGNNLHRMSFDHLMNYHRGIV